MTFDPSRMRGVKGGDVPSELNALTERIIGGATEVHRQFGPGVREHICEKALLRELTLAGVRVETRVPFRVVYKGQDMGVQVVDMLVEDQVVVECKCVSQVTDVDEAQLLGYLRFTRLPIGLLINFKVVRLVDGLTRRVNYPTFQGQSDVVAASRLPCISSAPSAVNSVISALS